MTLLVPLILGTLLSTLASGVDAKSKTDQIRVYQFISDDCDGSPHGANVDIKRNECVDLGSRSVKPRLDERRMKWIEDGDVIFKWMLHPWTRTALCYQCYTKKPGQYGWVKCRADDKMKDLCGAQPLDSNGKPLTTSTTVTTAATTETSTVVATSPGTWVTTTTISLPATTALSTPEAARIARSWHKEVFFKLPWADHRRMCADAEWEKRGKENWEVRLQDVHADDSNDCEGADNLDVADPIVETTTVTVGAMDTLTLSGWTAFSTSTVTVYTSDVTTIVASTHTPVTTSELQPVVVEITTPITIETEVATVVTLTTSSTIFPEAAEARAEAPPHRDFRQMSFLPRHVFPALPSLPRSYFLGHHHSGLNKMKSLLSSIDLVIECRDYRVPLTSRNPLFEKALEGKERVVVYTKRDLGGGNRDGRREEIVRGWFEGKKASGSGVGGVSKVVFIRNGKEEDKDGTSGGRKKSISKLLEVLKEHAQQRYKLVGHRVLVVGMPNVGKSTLLNALRAHGLGKGKVAKTGAQPGVTRKVGSGVKIILSEDDAAAAAAVEGGGAKGAAAGVGGGVYLLDTPGVFIPYVPDAHAMLKLALCGSVKDTIIPPVLLADYLLFHLNLHSPTLYSEYCAPTNDILVLLAAIAEKTGRLAKGGGMDPEATSLWLIQRWRRGEMGRFGLDELESGAEGGEGEEEGEESEEGGEVRVVLDQG
ncbi:hypothetical protein DE146DRAFT_682525 [Phaeosphaeria sp. MPI-PUGE-AT-0046c]|nr:hypothetical protein DE146DRAFT_682525 [Phaeosphaeria sp. MPI-PUGE-AT-0046c]